MKNYFIKDGRVFRRKHFCESTKRMRYEKELKVQRVGKYEYVYINGVLTNLDKVKMLLK